MADGPLADYVLWDGHETRHQRSPLLPPSHQIGAKMAGGPVARRRLLGAHFFSPAHIMPLLEIVRTTDTGPQARAKYAHTHKGAQAWRGAARLGVRGGRIHRHRGGGHTRAESTAKQPFSRLPALRHTSPS
jgi:hypothetical protein